MSLSPAERQRRLRDRQKRGAFVAPVEVSEDIAAMLIELGWLRGDDASDRECAGLAIQTLLEHSARKHGKNVTRYSHQPQGFGKLAG